MPVFVATPFDYTALSGVPRDPGWEAAAKAYLKGHPACAGCGRPATQVHHKKPFHLFPELEMVESNWAAVEPLCHLSVGHLGDWTLYEVLFDREARHHLARVTLARKRT